jgi:hypothetical protein
MKTRVIILSIFLSLFPLIAEAAGAPRTFKDLAGQIFTLLSAAITTIVILGILVYLWNIASNMAKSEEGFSNSQFRNSILWGIIILFVMVSVMGIVRLIASTLFGDTGSFGKSGAYYASHRVVIAEMVSRV